jgi:hypothetical protein
VYVIIITAAHVLVLFGRRELFLILAANELFKCNPFRQAMGTANSFLALLFLFSSSAAR